MTEHARIFGDRPARAAGRYFVCRHCGDTHRRGAVPHNCRESPAPRAPLSAPMLAPKFEPFVAEQIGEGVVIGDRHDKREYMARNELVEFDAGVTNAPTWVDEKREREELVQDIKRSMELDPAEVAPLERIGEADTEDAGDIDTADIEVIT